MEKTMNKNKAIISLTIIASILIITLPTIIKIYHNHEERLYLVATKKIIESAKNCYYDQICHSNTITVQELKNTGYLETDIVNPKTKTYFSETTTIKLENETFILENI